MLDVYLSVLKRYAFFSGRAGRREFWLFTLANFIITIALQAPGFLIRAVLGSNIVAAGLAGMFAILALLYSLAVLVPSLAVGVRRLHDTGRSGWWLAIVLVPFVGAIVLIVFYVLESQPGTNRWGPNPRDSAMTAQPAYAIDRPL